MTAVQEHRKEPYLSLSIMNSSESTAKIGMHVLTSVAMGRDVPPLPPCGMRFRVRRDQYVHQLTITHESK